MARGVLIPLRGKPLRLVDHIFVAALETVVFPA